MSTERRRWEAIVEQVDAGYKDADVRAFVSEVWALAPATLLVFAASAPVAKGAYTLRAADGRLLYAGSATSRRGLRKRLGEHLAHVQAGSYGEQWTARSVWGQCVVTGDRDQALVLELLTQRVLRPATFTTPRLRLVA